MSGFTYTTAPFACLFRIQANVEVAVAAASKSRAEKPAIQTNVRAERKDGSATLQCASATTARSINLKKEVRQYCTSLGVFWARPDGTDL